MSLFPAYAPEHINTQSLIEVEVNPKSVSPSLDLEESLLASDEEEHGTPGDTEERHRTRSLSGDFEKRAPPPPSCDYYMDSSRDTGNLRVSTIYYPGRPNYSYCDKVTLGVVIGRRERRRRRLKRYYESTVTPPTSLQDETDTRVAAYRRLIADAPTDVDLWLRFIRFQETCVGLGAALQAAEEACKAQRGAGGEAGAGPALLRRTRLRLARKHLPRNDYLAMLRDAIAAERCVRARATLWERLLEALAASADGSTSAMADAAAAALTDTAGHAPAYPALLRTYGMFLRAAGLWEMLVLLIELVVTMNFPSETFPPKADPQREAEAERELLKAEDEIAGSGLPLAARWARLERARASAHWRPKWGADDVQADPQRAPLASDVADLLRPSAGLELQLAATLLLLAKVPLLPGCGALPGRLECWEGALPLVRARRRLAPPAVPAAAALSAAAALLADPPHYYTAHSGYRAWVESLWDACCAALRGSARTGLVCWRLRWLHTLLLLQPLQEESGRAEARRIRGVARAVLRSWGGDGPLPFLQFARIEALVNGTQAGVKAASLSVRAALGEADCPASVRLYSARVLWELSGGGDEAHRALASAVMGRVLPDDGSDKDGWRKEALRLCEERCQELEEGFEKLGGAEEVPLEEALLPGAGEWAAARALLAPPNRRQALLHALLARPPPAHLSGVALRYWEQQACALVGAGAGVVKGAHALLSHAPHSAYLAAVCGNAPLWAGRGRENGAEVAEESEASAWGALLPVLLPALGGDEEGDGGSLRRAAAAAGRAARGAGGACAAAAALELGARAPRTHVDPARVLYEALDRYPQHKWLYVRGACWGGDCGSLADILLERQLRLHALPMELADAPAL